MTELVEMKIHWAAITHPRRGLLHRQNLYNTGEVLHVARSVLRPHDHGGFRSDGLARFAIDASAAYRDPSVAAGSANHRRHHPAGADRDVPPATLQQRSDTGHAAGRRGQ